MLVFGLPTTIYFISICLAKLSLLLLYYRIFALNTMTKATIYVGILTKCVFYLTSSVAQFAICVPRSGESWTSTSFDARLRKYRVMTVIQGIFGLTSDLYIFILPLPLLWRLHMPLKRKIGVTAIFLTGLMCVYTYSLESLSPFTISWVAEFVNKRHRAIIASSVALYYRALQTWHSDDTWNQAPSSGLA